MKTFNMKSNYIGSICFSGHSVSIGLYFCPESLSYDSLSDIQEKETGYIIAAPVCYLSQDFLDKHKIIFLKVGRDICESRFRPSARWKCTMDAMQAAANKRILDRSRIQEVIR